MGVYGIWFVELFLESSLLNIYRNLHAQYTCSIHHDTHGRLPKMFVGLENSLVCMDPMMLETSSNLQ